MKDSLLIFFLKNSTTVEDASTQLGVDLSQLISSFAELKLAHPSWFLIIDIEDAGEMIQIHPQKIAEVNSFLKRGGYTKAAFMLPVVKEEKLTFIDSIYNNGNKIKLGHEQEAEPYNRDNKLIETLLFDGIIEKVEGSKIHTEYKLTPKGINAYHTGELNLVKKDSPIQYVTNQSTTNNNTTNINQRVGGFANTGKVVSTGNNAKIREEIKDESIFDRVIGFFTGLFK